MIPLADLQSSQSLIEIIPMRHKHPGLAFTFATNSSSSHSAPLLSTSPSLESLTSLTHNAHITPINPHHVSRTLASLCSSFASPFAPTFLSSACPQLQHQHSAPIPPHSSTNGCAGGNLSRSFSPYYPRIARLHSLRLYHRWWWCRGLRPRQSSLSLSRHQCSSPRGRSYARLVLP